MSKGKYRIKGNIEMTAEKKRFAWNVNNRKEICQTCVLTVNEEECISPDGLKGNYIVMDANDWVVCIPVLGCKEKISERQFVMVKQWRHGAKCVSIEFPGGVINNEEKPEEAAARELLEETGYKAGELVFLGSESPNPAIMSNHVHFFAAFNLIDTKELHLDEDEDVEVLIQSESEVFKKMGTPEYPHALMSAAVALYRQQFSN